MKKFFTVILALCIGILGFSGCTMGEVEQTNEQLSLYISSNSEWTVLGGTVERYRELYPEVEVVVNDLTWNRTEDDDSYIERTRMELMAGKGPDVIFRPQQYFDDLEKGMSSGVFTDLTPFMEADPDYNSADYFQNVIEAGKRQGRQYLMPLSYDIFCLITSRENLDAAGIDPANCRQDYLSLARELNGYLERGGKTPVFDAPRRLRCYPDLLGLPLLDYDARTVDFSSPEFREAVELYKALYPQDSRDGMYIGDNMRAVSDILGDQCVFSFMNSLTAGSLIWNVGGIAAEETPVLLPIPAQDGRSVGLIRDCAAIRRNSPNQQNAWNFIKLLMGEEWQNGTYAIQNFPILRSGMEPRFTQAKGAVDSGSMTFFDGRGVQTVCRMGQLPEGFFEEYRSCAEEVGHLVFDSAFLRDTVEKYMEPYYKGSKSFDACLAELQGAMEIYMTE